MKRTLSRIKHKSVRGLRSSWYKLATGYDLDKKLLYINNPSGHKTETQDHAKVSFDDFEKFFAHKGIVIAV